MLSGEAADAYNQTEEWRKIIPDLTCGYAEGNIFNADETGIFIVKFLRSRWRKKKEHAEV